MIKYLVYMLLTGCSQGNDSAAVASNVDLSPMVRTETASLEVFTQDIQVQGTLNAVKSAVLIPRSPGRVKKVAVRIGDKVTEGQLLLSVDTQDYKQGLKEAQAAHRLSLAQLKQAKSNLKRFKVLNSKGVATKAQLEEVQVGAKLAKEQTNRTAAGMAVAQSRVNGAALKAPFSGHIIARNVEIGEMVGGPAQRPPLVLADISNMRVVGSIRESAVGGLSVGNAVEIYTQSATDEVYSATIDRINVAVDPVVRTVEFEAMLDNSASTLKHGMSATIRIANLSTKAVSVPRSALLNRDSGQAKVLILNGNIVNEQIVQFGQSVTDRVPIISGIEEGQKIVVAGQSRLKNGDRVQEVGID